MWNNTDGKGGDKVTRRVTDFNMPRPVTDRTSGRQIREDAGDLRNTRN